MQSYFTGKFTGGDIDLGTTVQTCSNKDTSDNNTTKAPPINIRACLFFDGTLNNRVNVEEGKNRKDPEGSYANDFSNIFKLESSWKEDEKVDFSFSIYVEGIGTTNLESDSNLAGVARGAGDTGIVAKVESGIAQIIQQINSRSSGKKRIENLFLDAFGFSRGAAAARNFIFAALHAKGDTLKDKLTTLGYSVSNVKIKFIGLFDTVASYGINHDNNTKEMHLNYLASAEKVVQLAAAEEHRKKFRLTNINSASNGTQVFLPGAHSDVGGGYVDYSNEEELQLLDLDRTFGLSEADKAAFVREKKWLLESGWYKKSEIHDVDFWNELKVTRKGIRNTYSLIPLKLMARYAGKKGVHFDPNTLGDKPIPKELRKIQVAIMRSSPTTADYWLKLNSQIIKDLRHDYLHFSSYYGSTLGANEPQFTGDDPVKGHRKRVIQIG